MDVRTAAIGFAAGRVTIGVALFATPRLAAIWVGPDGDSRGAQVITRAFGVRDAAIGLGTLAAVRVGAPLRPWLIAAALADAGDVAATLAGPPSRFRTAVLAVAAGATAWGAALAAAAER